MTWDKRKVIGRRIVDVELRSFPDGRGGRAHAPQIILDNGRAIRFVVEETEHGEYGVQPVLTTLWTNSYFVSTVGGAPLAVIKQYVENQKDV